MSETASNCRTSTSFTTMPPVLTDSQKGSVEDIQISLAPYIQSYLSQTGRRHSCCRVMLPVAFERAAPRSWLDPRFDSPVLEGQYQASVFPQLRLKFRFALFYILLCSLVWLLYFLLDGGPTTYTPLTFSIGLIFVFALLGLWVTGTDIYRAYTNPLSGCCAILLCMFSLALLLLTREALSPLGHFSICIEIVMLVYTIIPLPLWLCCTISVLYSVCFEVLSFLHQTRFDYNSRPAGTTARNSGDAADYYFGAPGTTGDTGEPADDETFLYKIILIRVLIQLCVHLIGVQILVMTVVRMRGTFMKVGQNLLVRRQLEMEKQLKEKMIHSMMPPKVADLLLKESRGTAGGKAAGGGSSFDQYSTAAAATPRRATPSDLKSLFRPFHMNRMENVSILFADIVGFTRMSATKTAEQLVEILNDLFERFDDLCLVNGCEKISTLGDCYYCVSGCPEPRPDHAICCVEMGLGMIESIRVFDAQRNEGIKMRVGVHTGTVLCGIVGTKRVKFDVWSNDVTLANRMESSGKPDQVHVSEETCGFLGDSYVIEEGEEVDGHRTYFVVGKKVEEPGRGSLIENLPSIGLLADHHHHHHHLFATTALDEALTGGSDHAGGSSCFSRSATNVSSIEPAVPPASPAGPVFFASLNASPISNPRPRLASLTKMTKFLRSAVKGGDGGRQLIGEGTPSATNELEKPRIIISTKSISDEFYTGGEEEQHHHFDRHTSAAHGSARELCSVHQQQQQSTGSHSPRGLTASSISRLQHNTGQNDNDDDDDWQPTVEQQLGESTHHTSSSFRSCWKVGNLLKRRHDPPSNADLESGLRNCDSGKCREEEVPCIGPSLVEQGADHRITHNSGENTNGNSQTNIASNQGCYQTLPILIVTPRPSNHTLADGRQQGNGSAPGNGASCSSAPGGGDGSMFIDEIIDVRSYISQSRSDISPFARTGSYRSQTTDRSSIIHELARGATGALVTTGGNGGTTSYGRPRSSTISAATASYGEADGKGETGPPQHARHASVAACSSARLLGPDGASLSPSATSRKDSGIRSNSRRSSIQHQIMLMNQSAALSMHRVSGYFTSSQSSLSGAMVTGLELEQTGRPSTGAAAHPPNGSVRGGNGPSVPADGGSGTVKPFVGPREPHPDPLAACLQQLRKQSDLQLIRCVRDNARSQRSYLVKPPLLPVSLCFKSRLMEKEFRSKAHRFGTDESIGFGAGGMGGIGLGELEGSGPPTLATPKYNTYIDLLVSFAIYLATSTSLFLLSPSVYLESYKVWVCIFVLFSTVQLFALFICTKQVCRRTRKPSVRRSRPITSRSCYDCLLQLASHWYPWHLCGGILMSLPVISILSNFAMMDVTKFRVFEFHYGFLMYICIVHFCNFTQLNWGMRNCMALGTAVAFIGIAIGHMVQLSALEMQAGGGTNSTPIAPQNGTLGNGDGRETPGRMLHQAQFEWFNNYRVEIYVDLFLLLVLVWFLNREFEIGYRLSFHGSAVASQDKVRVQNMKNQADMLLHNIIPKHVAEQLKNTAKYSENHHGIGIIFASIINFNEMYDESYLGGKEYLRVLNELIADFDELLARPEFRCVEKIKTIGSTFMAASGLDPSCRGENYEHLYALLDFALAMQQVVESFNRDLLEFNLIMRVGYNFGDVTAGVIGTSKLYYDIWGDAVNVASRMDSTGVAGRIQVGSDCVPVLSERYDFEPRGKVYVKGKDHMEVYLLVRKKPDLLGPPELDIDPL
ncbi:adenylate cyclase type 9-like [Anopheles albimanus]|uniref:adenylate cyclase n=1 Tax=Anopheles albimanus TaxID=7167 RepID=A0A182FJC3_ANOAL|nr:adenylate cyclase type 9-like [Anopheles albimanus]XP_035788306.1 adenylate cyclase type 9-like [Anopheles albimanus]